MDRNKKIENEIISRCNMGIILLTMIDVIAILFFFITLTISKVAIICSSVLVIIITFFILFVKRVKKNPLKYRKYFFNLKSAKK